MGVESYQPTEEEKIIMKIRTMMALGVAAAAIAAVAADGEFTYSRGGLRISKATDETVAAAAAAHPDAKVVTITYSKVSSFAPLAKLANLQSLIVHNVQSKDVKPVADVEALAGLKKLETLSLTYVTLDEKDLTCLSGLESLEDLSLCNYVKDGAADLTGLEKLTGLKKLTLKQVKIGDLKPVAALTKLKTLALDYSEVGDLSPLAALPAVKTMRFYSAEVKDFKPLAGVKTLEHLDYYAAKMEGGDWSGLGALKQVKKFNGGMNKMASVEWVKELPDIEELTLFNDPVEDWTPVASAKKLKLFKAWQMKKPVDAGVLANMAELKKVDLSSSEVKNFEALATLPKLEELMLTRVKSAVDLGVLKGTKTLKRLNVGNVKEIKGAGALGETSLKYFNVSKGQFPDAELDELTKARQAAGEKRFKVWGR